MEHGALYADRSKAHHEFSPRKKKKKKIGRGSEGRKSTPG